MDPITQGALGAAAAQLGTAHRLGRRAWLYGAAGGMAADLDVLIRSSTDPLLAIEYHRNFTHALSFIPIGGAIAALPWVLRKRHRPQAWWIMLATTLGYATHGLLDAFTTYGTQLMWPFSSHRTAWGFVSVVDLFFTLPLIAAAVMAARTSIPGQPNPGLLSRRWAAAGLVWCALYLTLGAWQHHRASSAQEALARSRGHTITRSDVFVSIANQVSWRSVYEADGRFYVDKIRAPYFDDVVITPGESAPVPDVAALQARFDGDPSTARGLRLMRWFSSEWIGHDPASPELISDLRYGHAPESLTTMWLVRLEPGAAEPVQWIQNTAARDISWATLKHLWWGDGPNAIRVAAGASDP